MTQSALTLRMNRNQHHLGSLVNKYKKKRSDKGCTPEPVQYIICHRLKLQASLAESWQGVALHTKLALITEEQLGYSCVHFMTTNQP